jgi:acyl carrier protein
MDNELTGRIINVIAQQQKVSPDTITIDKTFEDLHIDSFDAINIVFALETEFDVVIPDEAVREIHGVREVVEGVQKLVAEKRKGASGS